MIRHYIFGKFIGDMWAVTEVPHYSAQRRLVHMTVTGVMISRKAVNDLLIILFI